MKINKIFLMLILMILFLIPFSTAQQALLNRTNIVSDTFLSTATPDTNFGTSTTMLVSSADANDRLSIITWNLTDVLPFNATNITAFMNLTEENPTTTINLRIINATNFTWIEDGMTLNTFFCTTNANGTVDLSIPSGCTNEISTTTTSGLNNGMTAFNVSSTVGINTNFVTYVMDSQTGGGTLGTFNTKEGIVSEDPLLLITWDELNITPPPPPPPPPPAFNPTDTLDLTSCGITSSDMVLNPNGDILYILMRTVTGVTQIAIINTTDMNNLVLQSCIVDQGISGSALSISYAEGIPFSSSVIEGFLTTTNQAGTTSLNLYNVTNGGATLIQTFSIDSPGSQPFLRSRPSIVDSSVGFTDCRAPAAGDISISVTSSNDGLTVTTDTLDLSSTDCSGLSKPNSPFGVSGTTFHLVSDDNNGQFLLQDQNFIFNDTNTLLTDQTIDSIRFSNDFYGIFGNAFTIYEFFLGNTSISLRGTVSAGGGLFMFGGGELIGSTVAIGLVGSGVNSSLIQYNITNKNNIIQDFNQTVANFTTQGGTANDLEYDFPRLFIKSITLLKAFIYTPTSFNSTNNIKPRITNLASTRVALNINQTAQINYLVINPETDAIGERILTTHVCEYSDQIVEEETFDNNFNFTAVCDSFNIGNINGVNFGLGLNLATCNNDFLLIPTNLANETIISFDIFSPSNVASSGEIELIDFNGNEIIKINISYNLGGDMTVTNSNSGATLFENIPTNSVAGNVPTRLFIQLNPVTTSSTTNALAFMSTNVFVNGNANNIDQTFCNNDELCFIADAPLQTSTYNNFFGLFLDGTTTGTLALDNFKVRQLDQYPDYDSTLDLGQQFSCSYPSLGTKRVRVYTSDVVFQHNYLYYEDILLTVNLIGLPVQDVFVELTNSSGLATLITELAIIFVGGDEDSLLLVGLLTMLIFTIVASTWTGKEAGFEAGMIVFFGVNSILSIIFFVLGWFPLIALLLVILLDSGLIALMWGRTVMGG